MASNWSIEAGVRIPDREKRAAERDLKQSIGDVTVDVDAAQSGRGPSGGSSAASLAGGAGALDALDDQTDLLQDIHQELEKIGTSGGLGGGGGGGGGGILGGGSGFTLGNLIGSATGGAVAGGTLGKLGKMAGGLRGGAAGLAGRLAGSRSPWTLLQQTKRERDVSPSEGGPGGAVTDVMGDVATGEFQLKEDFWPDIKPPEDLWPSLSPPDGLWPSLSPPDGLWPSLSPPDGLWPGDLSPPDGLWPDNLQPPEDMWPSLEPPDGFWPSERGGSNGTRDEILSLLNLGSDGSTANTGNTPGQESWSPSVLPGPTSFISPSGDEIPVEPPEQTGSSELPDYVSSDAQAQELAQMFNSNLSASGSGGSGDLSSSQEARVDVVIQEVAARIDSGRTLQDALRRELEDVAPEIKEEVLAEIRADFDTR